MKKRMAVPLSGGHMLPNTGFQMGHCVFVFEDVALLPKTKEKRFAQGLDKQ